VFGIRRLFRIQAQPTTPKRRRRLAREAGLEDGLVFWGPGVLEYGA
jgi:hypothetical protein